MKIQHSFRTHPGKPGEHQRHFILIDPGRFFVIVNASGDSHSANSAMTAAIAALETAWKARCLPEQGVNDWLHDAINQAHTKVRNLKVNSGVHLAAAVYEEPNFLHIAKVGETAAYLFRGNTASELAKDSSIAEVIREMVQMGKLTEEQARHRPFSWLPPASGNPIEEIQYTPDTVALAPGDYVVLLSAGTTLGSGSVPRCLAGTTDANDACMRLIHYALQAGKCDAFSVIALKSTS